MLSGLEFRENHFASIGLQRAGDPNIQVLANAFAGAFYDDHRAVLQIAHALLCPFAWLDDFHAERFVRQIRGPQGIADFV